MLDGEDITACGPQLRVQRGLARTFQINQLFADHDAAGDRWASPCRSGWAWRPDWWRVVGSRTRCDRRGRRDRSALRPRRTCWTSARRRPAPMASSACSRSPSPSPAEPRVLLLDEPAAGVPEAERHEIARHRRARCRDDVSVLLIEHDMDLVFSFADRISVLVNGGAVHGGHRRGDRHRSARPRRLSRGGRR